MMAGSVNRVILVGNVGKDPEIRRTQDGRPICNLSVATSESWRDKATGDRKEKTEWHRVVIYSEPITKTVEQYVKKGSKIYVEGQLQTRKWADKDGTDRYSTEVVIQNFGGSLQMLDNPKQSGAGDDERRQDARQAAAIEKGIQPPMGNAPRRSREQDADSEIPF